MGIAAIFSRFLFLGKNRFTQKSQIAHAHKTLCTLLAYQFKDTSHLELALTHKSHTGRDDPRGITSNERLEFLGDAILNFVVTEHLYQRFPRKTEGSLSKMKSVLVSRKTLGLIAAELDLANCMIVGVSEEKSGGRNRPSVLSNALEAVIGAIYLDGGFECTRTSIEKILLSKADAILNDEENINYKSQILERSQEDGFGIPHYQTIQCSGPDHNKHFTIAVEVGGVILGQGSGSSKKIAQQQAAAQALKNYSKEHIETKREAHGPAA